LSYADITCAEQEMPHNHTIAIPLIATAPDQLPFAVPVRTMISFPPNGIHSKKKRSRTSTTNPNPVKRTLENQNDGIGCFGLLPLTALKLPSQVSVPSSGNGSVLSDRCARKLLVAKKQEIESKNAEIESINASYGIDDPGRKSKDRVRLIKRATKIKRSSSTLRKPSTNQIQPGIDSFFRSVGRFDTKIDGSVNGTVNSGENNENVTNDSSVPSDTIEVTSDTIASPPTHFWSYSRTRNSIMKSIRITEKSSS